MELKPKVAILGDACKFCSNRTFMELKPGISCKWYLCLPCSNRTFMELKQLKPTQEKEW